MKKKSLKDYADEARELKVSGLSYYEIGIKLGISRQRIHQLISPSKIRHAQIIESRNGLCDRCNAKSGRLSLHHKSYNSDREIEVLCPKCHFKADQENGTRPSTQQKKYKIIHSNNTSGYRGVTFFKPCEKWRASISINGKRHCLGYFIDKIDAAMAYDNAAKEYHGEFARVNF